MAAKLRLFFRKEYVCSVFFSLLCIPKGLSVNLIIDIGNTYTKLALFKGDQLIELRREKTSLPKALQNLIKEYPISKGILATVVTPDGLTDSFIQSLPFPLLTLDWHTKMPIRIAYSTPSTLGSDRIAAVVGARAEHPGKNLLIIDAGTAITYDFLSADGVFHGGNIAPGKQMRFQALHDFTQRLPLINEKGKAPVTGTDTETAIRGGVMRGIAYEIKGYIADYKEKYPDLLVFLTGGDAKLFEDTLKNCIFADYFLVLKGLNRILNYNDNI